MEKVHLVSLGCPKNRVDSEVMVGKLHRGGQWSLVDEPADADVIIVNTCSFIQPATEESIDTVLEMAGYKAQGRCKKLVVTGCMVQRYGNALAGELPEVDHFLGTGEYHRIEEALQARSGEAPKSWIDTPIFQHDERDARVNSWAPHSAYLKISEGCDHTCTFCIIPKLRGRLRSRTIDSLVSEATRLVAEGVVELNLISQDSTAYGRDLVGKPQLAELIQALAAIDGLRWLRIHYAYPIGIPNALLEAMAEEEKVCRYLDMPLQHASGPMLKAMRRGVTREGQDRILRRVTEAVPGLSVRTTFIVGFPGETDEDFQELMDFVRTWRFSRVGVFTYCQEDGTPAAELPGQVEEEVKLERQRLLMELQAKISLEHHQSLVGSIVPVMLDGTSKEHDLLLAGRLESQAPEVDGQVLITSAPSGVQPGHVLPCRIVQAAEHDLVGEIMGSPQL